MKISALLIVLLSFRGTTAQIELPPLDGFSLLPCVPDPSVIDAYTPPYKASVYLFVCVLVGFLLLYELAMRTVQVCFLRPDRPSSTVLYSR